MKKLILLLLVTIIVSGIAVKGCIEGRLKVLNFEQSYRALQDSARIVRDENGRLHAQNTLLLLQKADANLFYGRQIDSLAHILKVKPKAIKSIVQIPFEGKIPIDTLYHTDTLFTIDTINHTIDIKATLALTKYKRNTGFLGLKTRTYLDASFDNPVFRPLDLRGFEITEKPKHWGIGIIGGYGSDGRQLKPFVGIGVSYNVLSF